MADRVMCISFGETVRGREERALEVFNESIGLYGQMQQDGRIERFSVVLLDPTGGPRGYFELFGSAEQLARVREDHDFRRTMVDATLIVDDVKILTGFCDAGVADEVAIFQEAIAKVPQTAS